MLGRVIQPEIDDLIQRRDFTTLKEVFVDWHPAELADLITDLPETDRVIVFRSLGRELAADAFEYLDVDAQKAFLKTLGQEEVAGILNELSPDDRTAFFEELPGTIVRQLLALLAPSERAVAVSLLGYPEDSVGRLMTPDYIAVLDSWSARRAMDHIRERARDVEFIEWIFVVDARGILIDDIRLKELLVAEPDAPIVSLMDRSYISLSVTDLKEQAVDVFKEYDRVALPVVNTDGALLGIVTVDDVLDVVEEIDTQDIQRFGGVEALDYPYIKTPLLQMVKKRAGWLVILFLSEMLTATAMGYFQGEIARAVVLALFVPLIISSGGNSGSQAATLIIRAMALQEISLRDWWKVMRREIISGLILGSILGFIGFCRIQIWSMFTDIYGVHSLLVALTVGFSLIGVVLWGTLAGSMLPFALRRIGFDPASSSAPFVATLVDVTGLVIYFTVAAFILHGTML